MQVQLELFPLQEEEEEEEEEESFHDYFLRTFNSVEARRNPHKTLGRYLREKVCKHCSRYDPVTMSQHLTCYRMKDTLDCVAFRAKR